MADMSYVRVYVDYVETVDELSDTEAGRLFKAILHYADGSEEVELRGGEKLVFGIIKRQIDRDAKAYTDKSEAYRAAALKREQAKRTTTDQKQPQQSTNNHNCAELWEDKEEDKDKEKDKEEHKEKVKREKRFAPPTVEEVRAYCTENGYAVNPARFVDYYTSKGWTVGRSPMKDWRAAVRQWAARDKPEKPAAPAIDISAAYGGDVL